MVSLSGSPCNFPSSRGGFSLPVSFAPRSNKRRFILGEPFLPLAKTAPKAEPQTHARGMIVETQSPVWGTVRSPASPVRAGKQRAEHYAAPARGQHTVELCEQLLDYDPETIRELAEMICRLCDYHGRIEWDSSQPDGQPRRCLDTTRAKHLLDWTATTSLEAGLRKTIDWYRSSRGDSDANAGPAARS